MASKQTYAAKRTKFLTFCIKAAIGVGIFAMAAAAILVMALILIAVTG